ncbi:MAG: hypothetical protein PVJ60_07005, partial [Phycisphaerales bacterium]
MAKILGIFKKIKSLSAYVEVTKNFGKNFIFPFTPLRFWQIFLFLLDFSAVLWYWILCSSYPSSRVQDPAIMAD